MLVKFLQNCSSFRNQAVGEHGYRLINHITGFECPKRRTKKASEPRPKPHNSVAWWYHSEDGKKLFR